MRGFVGDYACFSGGSGRTLQTASRNRVDVVFQDVMQRLLLGHLLDSGVCQATRRPNRHCAIAISIQSACPESPDLAMLNSIEPLWYVTRMPGGVTGKAREGLPMPINCYIGDFGMPKSAGQIVQQWFVP